MAQPPDTEFIALQEALAGEYSLDREIGRGGMGVVYLAREVRLSRPVAIKVLPPALAAQTALREAFLREARTAASLNHPNIVPVYATGERNGFAYIVMAYVDGVTLGHRIRTRGPLLPGQAARVLREVAWGLAYAHAAHIVHRDVSAENILLERGSERAIITDFGLASAMQTSALSHDGQVMGNAHYVSPEQAVGEPLDARSDLYSLGITGFYALTGRLPFDGETSAEVVRQHLTTPAPSITSVSPTVPPRLAAAVERCLHKEPIRRYRNAESFAEAIDLAFEHAKEIPTALRSWINQGEQEGPARIALVGIGTMAGVTLVYATNLTWTFLVPFGLLGSLGIIPMIQRLRRVLGDGYAVDDLHAALREHQLVRSEEREYERRQISPRMQSASRILFTTGAGSTAIGAWLLNQLAHMTFARASMSVLSDIQTLPLVLTFFGAGTAAVAGIPLLGEFMRFRLAARASAASISFWRSAWGRRLARIASIGMKPAERPMLGMPVLTEIALGRATDHLYAALPKDTRRELSALPDAVRRLEADASGLRSSIGALDDQLAMFERSNEAMDETSRATLATGLRETRAVAAERLAATVAALENIRLDLLRLQMGNAEVSSVTASIDAARRIGDQIGESLAAQAQVERLLLESRTGALPDSRADRVASDDDADTPVGGVPAARG